MSCLVKPFPKSREKFLNLLASGMDIDECLKTVGWSMDLLTGMLSTEVSFLVEYQSALVHGMEYVVNNSLKVAFENLLKKMEDLNVTSE